MKKSLFVFVFVSIFFAGCDTEGDPITTGYVKLNTSFKPSELGQNYRITFNGNESRYIQRDNPTGTLEVFPVSGNTTIPVLKEENWTTTNDEIVFIKPVGSELAIYSEDKYITFIPNVIFSGDANLYSLRLNEDELTIGKENYIPKSNLPGTLKIINKESNNELFAQELTANSSDNVNIMQLSDTDFLEISETSEADPENGFFKARMFYTADAFPGHSELTLILRLANKKGKNPSEPIATITLKANKLSEYILIDNNYYGEGYVVGTYDLIDNDGNKIVDYTTKMKSATMFKDFPYGRTYKFMTFRITNKNPQQENQDDIRTSKVNALCIPWE